MTPEIESDLDDDIVKAHRSADLPALVRLYRQAAERAEAVGDIDQACFFFTQAYVFALDCGSPQARALNQILYDHGRDVLLSDLPGDDP